MDKSSDNSRVGEAPLPQVESEEELRKALLKAQIEAHRVEGKRGWLWHMGPTLSAVLASVAASLILILFGGQLAKGIVAYFQSGVAEAQSEQEIVVAETQQLISTLDALTRSMTIARAEESDILGRIRAKRDSLAQDGRSASLGLSVEITDEGTHYMLSVDTFPGGAEVSAFTVCRENFVFPTDMPDPKSCELFFDLISSDGKLLESRGGRPVSTRAPCQVGPIGKMGNMDNIVWVRAELEDEVAVRFVHVTGR